MQLTALNLSSSMGTVISPRHLARIQTVMERYKASGHGRIITGGERLSGTSPLDGFDLSRGVFFPPTIITDVHVEDEVWQEEIFGPIVVVKQFDVRVNFIDIYFYADITSLSDRGGRYSPS
jgi:acyl-CoA reductase-like NAD-dependent aldehyde dehydrogenase